jgi:hypothetical protein
MPVDIGISLGKSGRRTHEEKREEDSVDWFFIISAVD